MAPKHGKGTRSEPPALPDTWYVSYRSNITPKKEGEVRVVRGTRNFKTEVEAKKFAQEIISSGWSAIAGTINPYKPKKTVASKQLLNWIAQNETCNGECP